MFTCINNIFLHNKLGIHSHITSQHRLSLVELRSIFAIICSLQEQFVHRVSVRVEVGSDYIGFVYQLIRSFVQEQIIGGVNWN